MKNMNDVITMGKANGYNHWFSDGAMKHQSSVLESELHHGKYFLTSETDGPNNLGERKYSIRQTDEDGFINTVGNFQEYETRAKAATAMCKIIKHEYIAEAEAAFQHKKIKELLEGMF